MVTEPMWPLTARSKLGTREALVVANNQTIISLVKRLGTKVLDALLPRVGDDETARMTLIDKMHQIPHAPDQPPQNQGHGAGCQSTPRLIISRGLDQWGGAPLRGGAGRQNEPTWAKGFRLAKPK